MRGHGSLHQLDVHSPRGGNIKKVAKENVSQLLTCCGGRRSSMLCSWTHSRCSFRRAYSPVPSWTRKLLSSCGGNGGGGGAAGFRDDGGVTAVLQYQRPPVPGERVGRVISGEGDEGPAAEQKLTDVHVPATVHVENARRLVPQPTLDSRGFELRRWGTPTAATVAHLADEQLARRVFYPEVGLALYAAAGGPRGHLTPVTMQEDCFVFVILPWLLRPHPRY